MPKMIDSEKLLKWIEESAEAEGFWNQLVMTPYDSFDKLTDAIAAGTFDPTPPVIKPGDRVMTITGDGKWKGLKGTVQEITADDRAQIDFGKPFPLIVTIPLKDLEVIPNE